MFKRNWSIWLLLILTLGVILTRYFSDHFARDQRISIEDFRIEEVALDADGPQDTAYVWDEEIRLASDESLYDVSAFDGMAYYVTAVNQLREQYAYTYRFYRYGTEPELITELPDAKPHRLNIAAIDSSAIIFAKEYSDGKTELAGYHFASGQFSAISQWDGPPSRAKISYFQNTVGLVIDNTWGIYNLQGQIRPVRKNLPAGSIVRSLSAGPGSALIYYEVDELRYLMLYQFGSQQSTTWLVNDRVNRIYLQTGWAITQSDNGLQLYTWPNLSIQRLTVTGNLNSLQVISDRLIDIRLLGSRNRPYIFDMSDRQTIFSQQVDVSGSANETIRYYYVPAVDRINRLRFVD
ncbi:MAG: hypothetical protein GX978_06895 [Tissierellia bacterium]|jgi:hypothetical protein|nr:hypothetical protein [Tissierellia bacterium]